MHFGFASIKKGFVFTIATLLIFSMLIYFAQFYLLLSSQYQEDAVGAEYIARAGYIADDIGWDLTKLMGVDVNFERNETALSLRFRTEIAPANMSDVLDGYKDFIENTYAKAQNVNISLGLDETGRIEFSNGIVYEYNYSLENTSIITIYNSNGGTGFTDLSINISSEESGRNGTQEFAFNPDGDMGVNVRYADGEGYFPMNGIMSSTGLERFTMEYGEEPRRTLEIRIGDLGGVRTGAIMIIAANGYTASEVNITASMAPMAVEQDLSYQVPVHLTIENEGVKKITDAVVLRRG
ncbi:Uncharacterised protein [Candidatus Gugararchaeum adminiculabundum]|nr:Uncharacterised protein [Candidatus Gugararchaeum adminiculabundum]